MCGQPGTALSQGHLHGWRVSVSLNGGRDLKPRPVVERPGGLTLSYIALTQMPCTGGPALNSNTLGGTRQTEKQDYPHHDPYTDV